MDKATQEITNPALLLAATLYVWAGAHFLIASRRIVGETSFAEGRGRQYGRVVKRNGDAPCSRENWRNEHVGSELQ